MHLDAGRCPRRRPHNRRVRTPLVFLVPGFFGFTSVGAVSHFADVERTLGGALRRRGVKARIVCCNTPPTASIRRRAAELLREVRRRGALKAPALHFVGHYALAAEGHTADWLPSGAGCTPQAFEATWDAVAAAIAGTG